MKAPTYTSTQISKALGYSSAKALHTYLKNKGVIKRIADRWVLTVKYTGKNLSVARAYDYSGKGLRYSVTLKWTEKGYKFLKRLCDGKK